MSRWAVLFAMSSHLMCVFTLCPDFHKSPADFVMFLVRGCLNLHMGFHLFLYSRHNTNTYILFTLVCICFRWSVYVLWTGFEFSGGASGHQMVLALKMYLIGSDRDVYWQICGFLPGTFTDNSSQAFLRASAERGFLKLVTV